MSTYDDEQDDDDATGKVTIERSQIKSWQKQAKQAAEAEARAEAAERKLAFAEAGIPLTDPKMAYFVKGYDGEFTPEAIKQAATDAGFIAAPVAPDDSGPLQRTQQVAAGAQSPDVSADAEYFAALDAAKSPEEVTAIAAKFGRLVSPQ